MSAGLERAAYALVDRARARFGLDPLSEADRKNIRPSDETFEEARIAARIAILAFLDETDVEMREAIDREMCLPDPPPSSAIRATISALRRLAGDPAIDPKGGEG